jgi:hypothetical protein
MRQGAKKGSQQQIWKRRIDTAKRSIQIVEFRLVRETSGREETTPTRIPSYASAGGALSSVLVLSIASTGVLS